MLGVFICGKWRDADDQPRSNPASDAGCPASGLSVVVMGVLHLRLGGWTVSHGSVRKTGVAISRPPSWRMQYRLGMLPSWWLPRWQPGLRRARWVQSPVVPGTEAGFKCAYTSRGGKSNPRHATPSTHCHDAASASWHLYCCKSKFYFTPARFGRSMPQATFLTGNSFSRPAQKETTTSPGGPRAPFAFRAICAALAGDWS